MVTEKERENKQRERDKLKKQARENGKNMVLFLFGWQAPALAVWDLALLLFFNV